MFACSQMLFFEYRDHVDTIQSITYHYNENDDIEPIQETKKIRKEISRPIRDMFWFYKLNHFDRFYIVDNEGYLWCIDDDDDNFRSTEITPESKKEFIKTKDIIQVVRISSPTLIFALLLVEDRETRERSLIRSDTMDIVRLPTYDGIEHIPLKIIGNRASEKLDQRFKLFDAIVESKQGVFFVVETNTDNSVNTTISCDKVDLRDIPTDLGAFEKIVTTTNKTLLEFNNTFHFMLDCQGSVHRFECENEKIINHDVLEERATFIHQLLNNHVLIYNEPKNQTFIAYENNINDYSDFFEEGIASVCTDGYKVFILTTCGSMIVVSEDNSKQGKYLDIKKDEISKMNEINIDICLCRSNDDVKKTLLQYKRDKLKKPLI